MTFEIVHNINCVVRAVLVLTNHEFPCLFYGNVENKWIVIEILNISKYIKM